MGTALLWRNLATAAAGAATSAATEQVGAEAWRLQADQSPATGDVWRSTSPASSSSWLHCLFPEDQPVSAVCLPRTNLSPLGLWRVRLGVAPPPPTRLAPTGTSASTNLSGSLPAGAAEVTPGTWWAPTDPALTVSADIDLPAPPAGAVAGLRQHLVLARVRYSADVVAPPEQGIRLELLQAGQVVATYSSPLRRSWELANASRWEGVHALPFGIDDLLNPADPLTVRVTGYSQGVAGVELGPVEVVVVEGGLTYDSGWLPAASREPQRGESLPTSVLLHYVFDEVTASGLRVDLLDPAPRAAHLEAGHLAAGPADTLPAGWSEAEVEDVPAGDPVEYSGGLRLHSGPWRRRVRLPLPQLHASWTQRLDAARRPSDRLALLAPFDDLPGAEGAVWGYLSAAGEARYGAGRRLDSQGLTGAPEIAAETSLEVTEA